MVGFYLEFGAWLLGSLLQKFQKPIEKKSTPQELEKIRTEFFFCVPFKGFWKMVFIHWAYESPVLNLWVAVENSYSMSLIN
jgi:hypothetical protein